MLRTVAVALSTLAVPAQTTALVVSHDSTPGAPFPTQVYSVDLMAGMAVHMQDFTAARYAPLAACFDPIRRDLIIALDRAPNSMIVRLSYRQGALSFERTLATLPGTITALNLLANNDIAAITRAPNAAAYSIPRLGGTVQRVATLTNPTAMTIYQGSNLGLIAESRTATSTAQLLPFDFDSGKARGAAHSFPNFTATITGLVDLPSGAPRQTFTTDLGRVFLSTSYATPIELALSPALTHKGTTAVHLGQNGDVTVLGGSTHPFLKSFRMPYAPIPQQWSVLTAPIPGDPIDFFFLPLASAGVDRFGEGCPGTSGKTPGLGYSGSPALGSTGFSLTLSQADAGQNAIFTLGFSDLSAGGATLPLSLLGSCSLQHSAEITVSVPTDAQGSATLPTPIPNDPRLTGLTIFAQAFTLKSGLAGTSTLAIHIH